jgi:hypothetical protein
MTTLRGSRTLTALALATAFAGAAAGCSIIPNAENSGHADVPNEMADRLDAASKLTYTAEYRTLGGRTVTVAQAPRKAAYRGQSGSYLVTPDYGMLCETARGSTSCRTTRRIEGALADSKLLANVLGEEFVGPKQAAQMFRFVADDITVHVGKSEETVAGLASTCVEASSVPNSRRFVDFTACVTQDGILTSFKGTLRAGATVSAVLTNHRPAADQSAFEPPAGAKVTDPYHSLPSPKPTR